MSRLLPRLVSLFQSSRRRRKRMARSNDSARLSVETLEARVVPSVSYVPSQMQHAYGMDRIAFEDATHSRITGNGAGETIGIVDAYDDPNIASDLAYFDSYFGLSAPASFSKVNQTGGTSYPSADSGWATEISIDVEWAHVMAPGASILLVEASSNSFSDLLTAVQYAANHANVVSMSWSGGEWSGEPTLDSDFTQSHVTYFASTGDNGAPAGYPAYSPNVVAVGGTSLNLDSSGNYSSETGWSGSGGGISAYESQPSYQSGVVTQSTTNRCAPDISMDADPNTGVWVYNSYSFGGTHWQAGWGGTSLACPLTAGVTAVVDQGDAYLFNGYASFSGGNYLNALYHLPYSELYDVTSGNNGYSAGAGYDLVTGRGTPIADRFVSGMDGVPVYNPLTGELLVTGGAHNSSDTITLSQNASSQLVVQVTTSTPVPGTGNPSSQTFYYNSGTYSSVTICTTDGSGSTTVNIQNTTGVTVNLETYNTTTVNVGASGSPAHNTVNVWETSGGPLTINGSGTMTVNVGKNGSVQNIQYYVLIDNPPSFTTVNVDDSADTANRTVYMGVTSFNSATWEYVGGLGGSYIYAKVGDTTSMTVDTGKGTDTVNVYATDFATYIYNSGGAAYVYVGSGGSSLNGSMASILGLVDVYGPGSTQLFLGDSADATSRTVNLYNGEETGLSTGNIYWTPTSTSTGGVTYLDVLGSGAGSTYTVNGTSAFYYYTYLQTGTGSDTVNVLATTGNLYVNNTGSQDYVYVGSGGSALNGTMANISGLVDVYGNGATWLYLGDEGDTSNRSVSLNNGSLTGLSGGTIYWSATSTSTGGVTFLGVYGGSGGNTYTVNATSNFYYYTYLNTGGGTDTTNILATTGALYVYTTTSPYGSGNDQVHIGNGGSAQGINGQVYIYNYPSSDHVTIDDSADTANRAVTIGSSAVTGLTPAAINFVTSGSASTLTILGGSGTDSYTVAGTPVNTSVTVTGGSGTNTLIGPNVSSTWNITGSNAGTLHGIGLVPVNFTSMANLTGGSGNDAFVFSDGAGVTGNVDGGGGTNMLDYLAYSTSVTVDLTAPSATGVGGTVANIQQLRGGQSNDTLTGNTSGNTTFFASPGGDTISGNGTGNTLVGTDAASTWRISSQNGGDLTWGTNDTSFTGIQNLTGGSGNDDFVVADTFGVDGNVNGGGGTNTLDLSAYTTAIAVNLGAATATGVGGTIANLQTFIGAGAGGNTLQGTNAATTWNITAQNAGTLTGGISFSAFQNLTGGSGNDSFVLSNGNGVDGNIDGGGGTNKLTESAYTTAVAINLTALTATGVGGTFANLQSFIGGSGNNTLSGPSSATTWNLSGSNAGTLTGGFAFSAFGNLTSGGGGDTFVFADGATLSGALTGGGSDTLDYSAYKTSVIVDLQTGVATGVGGGVTGIVNVKGGNSSGSGLYNLLIGNGGNTLTGGSSRRNILVAGSSASTLNGGGQDDLLIGGTTSYDTESGLTSWKQIAAYWAGSDSYSTRVSNLTSGSGVPLLDATTVTGNGGSNTMTGTGELALLYTDGADTISSFNASSQTVTISP